MADSTSTCGRRIRRCNWVRFLARADEDRRPANLRRVGPGSAQFEITRTVEPGEELVASFGEGEDEEGEVDDPRERLANELLIRAISSIVSGK